MSIKNEIIHFCQSIGSDPLLVQGAGGNVSWKDGDVLWVKASGTWLADAGERDIFVPVDLAVLRVSLDAGDFETIPTSITGAALRPSIETLLHALMPHQVVVHLHPVDVLTWLVREYSEASFPAVDRAALVPYRKPGAALAQAVAERLNGRPDIRCLFLQNHGLVLGGETVTEIQQQLQSVLLEMRGAVLLHARPMSVVQSILEVGGHSFKVVDDADIQGLAFDELLYTRLSSGWALYPDHVVFLGGKATCYDSMDDFIAQARESQVMPELVFVRGGGVYVTPAFGRAQRAQLRCYYDVLVRVPENCKVVTLSELEVGDLLNWDAEKYRVGLKLV
jgi:rhamnose utilization protein RhaD (predicted bifunctional aldolase and dehydrogenase)